MNTSKKIILIGSGVLATALIAAFVVQYFCIQKDWNNQSCYFLPGSLWAYTFIFIPIFIFSIITYFLNEKTFIVWRKFTLWWLLFSFILILIAPTEDNFFGNIKELAGFISAGGFVLFSTLLILYKSYKLRLTRTTLV